LSVLGQPVLAFVTSEWSRHTTDRYSFEVSNQLEERIAAIESRNLRVEGDKAWEGSWTRRLTIATITYLIVLAYGYALGSDRPYLNAIVPTAGFLLSTLTVPVIKQTWITRHQRRKSS
jgi:hypothetical protein